MSNLIEIFGGRRLDRPLVIQLFINQPEEDRERLIVHQLRGQGIGMELVRRGLGAAMGGAWHFCFVSGAPDYYPKLGFSKINSSSVDLPAEIEEERLHIMRVSGDSLDDLLAESMANRLVIQASTE